MVRLFSHASAPTSDEGPSLIESTTEQSVVRLFALVGEAIAEATHALLAGDRELAKRVVEQDKIIDALVDSLIEHVEAELTSDDVAPRAHRESSSRYCESCRRLSATVIWPNTSLAAPPGASAPR
jgi:phosphate uptake regulator